VAARVVLVGVYDSYSPQPLIDPKLLYPEQKQGVSQSVSHVMIDRSM